MIARSSRLWTQDNRESASFTNNRRQYWGYDAEGHATATVGDSYGYDVTACLKTPRLITPIKDVFTSMLCVILIPWISRRIIWWRSF